MCIVLKKIRDLHERSNQIFIFYFFDLPLSAIKRCQHRSVLPIMTKHGIKAFHIGYNGVGGLPMLPGAGTPFSTGSSFCGSDFGCPAQAVFK
jgi:hypothetical protein